MALSQKPTIIEKFVIDEKLISIERVRPKRPQVGTVGRKIKLLANTYPMTIPGTDCHHYGNVFAVE
jgi:hypothetical protein